MKEDSMIIKRSITFLMPRDIEVQSDGSVTMNALNNKSTMCVCMCLCALIENKSDTKNGHETMSDKG